MKKLLFLFASLVLANTSAKATTNISEAQSSIMTSVRGYGNSFIFNEAGIEFSIFADGQFDFFIPNYGPDVSIGINSSSFALSFNSGFNYNPYVQYDSFGAIIQIENTPIFYDFYGRVNQVGNILVNYNGFGRINRIGGLNVFYRNNVFWRYDGFINVYNRGYVWRPWHRYYAVPHINFCIVNRNPYRQFYAPVRYTYYRPYRNNVRHFDINYGRGENGTIGRRNNTTRNRNRYEQSPRNARERAVRKSVKGRNQEIARTRTAHIRGKSITNNRNSISSNEAKAKRYNARVVTPTGTSANSKTLYKGKAANKRLSANARTKGSNSIVQTRNNVTRTVTPVSKKVESTRRSSVKKPKATKSSTYNKAKSRSSKQRITAQNKRKSSSVTSRSNSSRKSNQSTTRSNSRRSRG